MGALCAVSADDFLLALAGQDLRNRQPRRYGWRHADTHSVNESCRQAAMHALPAQMKSIHVE
jgi:hypothetical protein